jgi:hypothetical protein
VTSSQPEPLAPARYKLQLTASHDLKQELEQCRDLMRHANPGGDFAPIIERALELLLDQLMRERFGTAKHPQAAKKVPTGRHIARDTRRTVVSRDGLRCAWVADDGTRCSATGWLELDHEEPFARGGSADAENVRVLCRAHNRLEAERVFGRKRIEWAINANRDQPSTRLVQLGNADDR